MQHLLGDFDGGWESQNAEKNMDVNDCDQEVLHNNENSGHFDYIPFILYSGEECFADCIHVLRL